MVNTKELKKDAENRKVLKHKCFNKILEFIDNKILLIAKTNTKTTWYEIPLFLLGHPTYEMKECSEYLMKKLKKNGFTVNFLNPNILLINWE
tara:strand:+ start:2517 stop:2792 length:276 start_codon:yes stop_codon:yes gene_type:complete